MTYFLVWLAGVLVTAGILVYAVDRYRWLDASAVLAFVWPLAGLVWLGHWLASKTTGDGW